MSFKPGSVKERLSREAQVSGQSENSSQDEPQRTHYRWWVGTTAQDEGQRNGTLVSVFPSGPVELSPSVTWLRPFSSSGNESMTLETEVVNGNPEPVLAKGRVRRCSLRDALPVSRMSLHGQDSDTELMVSYTECD